MRLHFKLENYLYFSSCLKNICCWLINLLNLRLFCYFWSWFHIKFQIFLNSLSKFIRFLYCHFQVYIISFLYYFLAIQHISYHPNTRKFFYGCALKKSFNDWSPSFYCFLLLWHAMNSTLFSLMSLILWFDTTQRQQH